MHNTFFTLVTASSKALFLYNMRFKTHLTVSFIAALVTCNVVLVSRVCFLLITNIVNSFYLERSCTVEPTSKLSLVSTLGLVSPLINFGGGFCWCGKGRNGGLGKIRGFRICSRAYLTYVLFRSLPVSWRFPLVDPVGPPGQQEDWHPRGGRQGCPPLWGGDGRDGLGSANPGRFTIPYVMSKVSNSFSIHGIC